VQVTRATTESAFGYTALIKDVKHVKWAQRIIEAAMLPSLVVGQTNGSESTSHYRTGTTTVKCGLGSNMTRKILVRNKANITLQLEYRRGA